MSDGNLPTMTNMAKMSKTSREFAHGRVYRESPHFTCPYVQHGSMYYKHGDYVMYDHVDVRALYRIVGIMEKDGQMQCTAHRFQPGENDREVQLLWGVEEVLHPSGIVSRCEPVVMVRHGERVPTVGVYCRFAVLKWDGQVDSDKCPLRKLVSVSLLPKLLFENIDAATRDRMCQAEMDKRVLLLRLLFLYYYDDFRANNKVVHGVGAGYLGSGNLPRGRRQRLTNMPSIHLAPKGVPQHKVSGPFVHQLKYYEQCKVKMRLGSCDIVCTGAIGCALFDMPQGNSVAHVKKVTAKCPCRRCMAANETLTGCRAIDPILVMRRPEDTERQIQQIKGATPAQAAEIMARTSVSIEPQLLDGALLDRERQVPFEPFHLNLAGNSIQVLLLVLQMIAPDNLGILNARFMSVCRPATWGPADIGIITPSTDYSSFPGTGVSRVKNWMCLMHGVLVDWLEFRHFTAKWGKWLLTKFDNSQEAVITAVLDAIATQAHSNTVMFAEEMPPNWELAEEIVIRAVDARKQAFNRIWGGLDVAAEIANNAAPAALSSQDSRMNQHAPDHAHTDATDYGTGANISNARAETNHGWMRTMMMTGNGKFKEVQMMVRSSIVALLLNIAMSPDLSFPFLADGVHEWMFTDKVFMKMLHTGKRATTYAEGDVNNGHDYAFENVVKAGRVIGVLSVGGVQAQRVAQFERFDREPYAKDVHPDCWYFLFSTTVVQRALCTYGCRLFGSCETIHSD